MIEQKEIQKYSKLEFFAKQVVEGFITGLHKSPFHGFSVEFAEHKQYNKGESTKHIDWKLFAKTDRLYVKTYEEETNLRCRIVIDNSSSMYYPKKKENNKIDFAIKSAAAITEMLKRQRDAFGISLINEKVDFHSEVKSSLSHQRLLFSKLETLATNENEGKSSVIAKNLHEIAERINRRSLVVIFSDMFDNSSDKEKLFSSIQHLKHNKHEVILFHILDYKTELELNFENRPYKFVDKESGNELKLNPNEVKDEYVKQAKERKQELKLWCGNYKVEYVEADISKGYNQVLLPFLLKRKKLF